MSDADKKTTLGRRVVAALVLVLAAWILLKLLVGFLGGVFATVVWGLVIVALLGAIVWALRALK
jgi:hypothetical protein